ncbi:hypothetical protein M0R36_10445 [bacterium]|jgi:hypothetical protein|nr:hypothetical protein [bacterium]
MARLVYADQLHFISNILGTFHQSMLDFFLDVFYPRFKIGIMTTADNTIFQITKYYENMGREITGIPLPCVSLDPTGDLDNDERTNYLWRYSNFGGGFGGHLYDPIYEDEYVKITPVYNRYKGTYTVYMFLSSMDEMLDMKLKLIQYFGGKDRYFSPDYIHSYLHIPAPIVEYRYVNDVLNIDQQLAWNTSLLEKRLFRVIAKDVYAHPITLNPLIRMSGTPSPSANKFGDSNNIPDYRLETTFEYEMDLPVHLVTRVDYKFDFSQCRFWVTGHNVYDPRQYEYLIDRSQMICDKKTYNRKDVMFLEPDTEEENVEIDLKLEITANRMVQVFDDATLMSQDKYSVLGNVLTINKVFANHIYHILIWEEA